MHRKFVSILAITGAALLGACQGSDSEEVPDLQPAAPSRSRSDSGAVPSTPRLPDAGTSIDGALPSSTPDETACAALGVSAGLLCDGFESDPLSARWQPLAEAGTVHAASGGGNAGLRHLASGFPALPAAGNARLALRVDAPFVGTRAFVRLPVDGYPARLGLLTARTASGQAVSLIAVDEGHALALAIDGTSREQRLGPLTLGAWTCLALNVDGVAGRVVASMTNGGSTTMTPSGNVSAVEIGLTYAGPPNANASVGAAFDDVAIAKGLLACPVKSVN